MPRTRTPAGKTRAKRAAQPDLLNLCPPFLTRQQAASVSGVTTRTVDRWLNDPAVKLRPHRQSGRRRPVLIDREELRALLAVEPEQAPGKPQE